MSRLIKPVSFLARVSKPTQVLHLNQQLTQLSYYSSALQLKCLRWRAVVAPPSAPEIISFLEELPNHSVLMITEVDRAFMDQTQALEYLLRFQKRGITVCALNDQVNSTPEAWEEFLSCLPQREHS